MEDDNAFMSNDENSRHVEVALIGDMAIVPVTFYDKNEAEKNEALGIEAEERHIEGEMMLNMSLIEGFYPARDVDGNVFPSTIVKLSGIAYYVEIPYEPFINLYKTWNSQRN